MYSENKNRSEGVLGGFIHKVILGRFYSESHLLSFKRTGFTLIEMLVMVLIIGILAAMELPQYQAAVARARYAQNIILVKAVYDAQQRYYMANNRYAEHFEGLDIQLPAGGTVYHDANGKEGMQYKKFYIRLNYTNAVYLAQNVPNGVMAYYMYLDGVSQPECAAFSYGDSSQRDDVANRVCQSMGGVFSRQADCRGDGSVCYYYRLP